MGTVQRAVDEPRPGFAKRAENFDRVIAEARAWTWQPGQTVGRVMDAVISGAFDLSMADRALLALYASHLNQERLEQGDACVWPSTQLMCRRMGCSERTARMARARLERLGYMVRDYNRLNRPAGEEAYDLRPLLARLDALERADAELRRAFTAEREARYQTTAGLHDGMQSRKVYTAQAAESFLHEQSHGNLKNTVPQKATATPPTPNHGASCGRETARPPSVHGVNSASRKPSSAICSPEGASASAGVSKTASVAAETLQEELQMAAQACPRLFSALPSRMLAAGHGELGDLAANLGAMLPEPERNNGRTVAWGWRNHGQRMLVMLAVALEDPNIRHPARYFGSMATTSPGEVVDLRPNLRRILGARTGAAGAEIPSPAPKTSPPAAPSVAPLMAAPGADDPTWLAIAARLPRIIGDGPYGSWFARVGFEGLDKGILSLTTPTSIAAERIKRDFVGALLRACELAGFACDRVLVTIRRPPRPGG